jgi:hypothetical protein
MKLFVPFFLLLMLFPFSSDAQVNPHAIGLRFREDGRARGAEISYQHGFGDKNRLEVDAGWRNHKNWSSFGIALMFHWVWNLTDGLNWYIGPGGAIGNYRHKVFDERGLTAGVGGQIGIEYDFNQISVPLLLSIDWRPIWGFYEYSDYDAFGYEGGFSLRYTF